MSDLRRTMSWLLLVLVAVLGLGGAVLGISQAPKDATLSKAVSNTRDAPSYTQVVTETTPQGNQTDFLVWQAPDRLGGYIQSGKKRTYVFVLPSATGSVEYQSITVAATASTKHLVFYRQASQGAAAALDPAHNYLQYAARAKHVTKSGSTYSFTLTQTSAQGTTESGKFVYTVTGPYVSQFNLNVKGASIQLVISQVGSSPPVKLPAGAKIVAVPSTTAPSAGAAG